MIRRYGLYASRSRGKWEEQEHIVKLAPEDWKEKKELEAVLEESLVANIVRYTVFCDLYGLKRFWERALRYIFADFFWDFPLFFLNKT